MNYNGTHMKPSPNRYIYSSGRRREAERFLRARIPGNLV